MPETDILNPTATWQSDIQDSMTPDYGFTRKRSSTRTIQKGLGGVPYTRETQNVGHVFSLSWFNRSWACVQRLKRYHEQYEDGYFTLIDQDGGGRHYVGRFTTEVQPKEVANGQWSVEGVTFEEIPTVPMLQYPNDWANDAVFLPPYNDFGDQKVATSGSWTQVAPPALAAGARTNYAAIGNPGTTLGDWLQYEYRGYGFQLFMRHGPMEGFISVSLDGNLIQDIDLYSPVEMGRMITASDVKVPLDIHRVKVTIRGRIGRESGVYPGCTYYGLSVMR